MILLAIAVCVHNGRVLSSLVTRQCITHGDILDLNIIEQVVQNNTHGYIPLFLSIIILDTHTVLPKATV